MTTQPLIGEIRKGRDVGIKYGGSVAYLPCGVCGVPRWTQLVEGRPVAKVCADCNHRKHKILHGRGV